MKEWWLVSLLLISIMITSCSLENDLLYEEGFEDKVKSELETISERYDCNEYQYWEEVSDQFPYPGMNCESGPSKNIGVTVFILKEDSGEYVVREKKVIEDINYLNQVYFPHGISFNLKNVFLVDEIFEKEKYNNLFAGNYQQNDLNVVYISSSAGGSGCSKPWHLSGKMWPSCTIHPKSFRGRALAHEVGHFFGLIHTFENSPKIITPFKMAGPSWINPINECHEKGDYVCSTPYDCKENCMEVLGCQGIIQDKEFYEAGEKMKYNLVWKNTCNSEIYNPSTENLMAYYKKLKVLTKEQGARVRYYLMHRLNNEINDNQLQEFS